MEVTKNEGLNLNNTIIKIGSQSCPACRSADKWLSKNMSKYSGVTLYVIDINTYKRGKDNLSLEVKKVSSMPTFLFYSQGELVARIKGFNEDRLKRYIKRYLQ